MELFVLVHPFRDFKDWERVSMEITLVMGRLTRQSDRTVRRKTRNSGNGERYTRPNNNAKQNTPHRENVKKKPTKTSQTQTKAKNKKQKLKQNKHKNKESNNNNKPLPPPPHPPPREKKKGRGRTERDQIGIVLSSSCRE